LLTETEIPAVLAGISKRQQRKQDFSGKCQIGKKSVIN
jgi:hypothetical protein